jgi:hypothetical protein
MLFHLFFALSVHQIVSSLSHALWVVATVKYYKRSYKNIVLWDFKEILLLRQILGHYIFVFVYLQRAEVASWLPLITK